MATTTPNELIPAPGLGPGRRSTPGKRARSQRLGQTLRSVAQPQVLIVGLVVVIVAYLALVPLYTLIKDTLTGEQGGLSLDAFHRAYGEGSGAGRMLVNSLIFAFGSSVLALALGAALAYVEVRTNAPFKRLLFVSSMAPIVVPGFMYATAWVFLADPRIGLINLYFLHPIFRFDLNVYGLSGMIIVQGFHSVPIAFLLMIGAFRSMDPSLEEAGLVTGASPAKLFARVTLPLMRPALIGAALLVFVQSLESFEVPALLGLKGGTFVFTSRIYLKLKSLPTDYGAAGAYAIVLLAIAVVGVLLSSWLMRQGRKFQTVSGKAFRPRPFELGRSRPWVGGGVIAYFVIVVALPIAVLIYASFLPYYGKPSSKLFNLATLGNYRKVLDDPALTTAIKNTVIVGLVSATAVMVLTSIASWLVVRTKTRGRRLVDVLTFTPLVIPGLVLGLAISFVYLRSSLPIYGTLLILIICYVTRYLPYGMRYSIAAMTQISTELEESAMVCGATWWQSFRRVLLPIASSGIVAGWVYVLIVSFRELSATILLYSPGKEVLSVLIFNEYQDGALPSVAALGILMIAMLVVLVAVAFSLAGRVGLNREDRLRG
jgi:iron(III) transport system permease protein